MLSPCLSLSLFHSPFAVFKSYFSLHSLTTTTRTSTSVLTHIHCTLLTVRCWMLDVHCTRYYFVLLSPTPPVPSLTTLTARTVLFHFICSSLCQVAYVSLLTRMDTVTLDRALVHTVTRSLSLSAPPGHFTTLRERERGGLSCTRHSTTLPGHKFT